MVNIMSSMNSVSLVGDCRIAMVSAYMKIVGSDHTLHDLGNLELIDDLL